MELARPATAARKRLVNPIVAIELAGLVAAAIACWKAVRSPRLAAPPGTWVVAILILLVFGHAGDALDWADPSRNIDAWTDALRLLVPVFCGLFAYSWLEYRARRQLLLEQQALARRSTESAESRRRLEALIANVAGIVYRCRNDRSRTMEYISPYCRELTGYGPEQLIGSAAIAWADLILPSDRAMIWEEVQEALAAGKPFAVEYRILTAAGDLRQVREQGTGIWSDDGELGAVEGFIQDVTDLHSLSQRLAFQTTHDPLTGMLNRRGFEERVEQAVRRARQEGLTHGLCVLDLDRFKVINEVCGKAAGDDLLRQIARLIDRNVRNADSVARLGDDEFAILLENCPPQKLKQVMEKISGGIAQFRFRWSDQYFAVAISGGAVLIDDTAGDAGRLLQLADEYCNSAKDLGRNRIYYYDEADGKIEQRRDQIAGVSLIVRAIEEDRFYLCYQPMACIATAGDGVYLEVLLRMKENGGGAVPPGVLVPAAERYGLAGRLDRWVVDRALDWLAGNPDIASSIEHYAINLSGQTLDDTSLLNLLEQRLERMPQLAGRLCFEVTETAAVRNLEAAVAFIRVLRGLGCAFALDDFGSGLSSFAYLKNLDVDFLKIDGQFVRHIAADRIDFESVAAIHRVARIAGKKTIAEFVENAGCLEKLREIGVDFGQGYYFARPRPLEQFDSRRDCCTMLPGTAAGSQ
jgi:diguanylate cyclase (GGDEF)-like protein/PAS domain S-box-containing protein